MKDIDLEKLDPSQLKEMAGLMKEFAQAEAEVMQQINKPDVEPVQYFSDYMYGGQQPDEVPEVKETSSDLKLCVEYIVGTKSYKPVHAPLLMRLSNHPESKWEQKEKFGVWLMLRTAYRQELTSAGFDIDKIEKPDIDAIKIETPGPLKAIRCDDRSLGFVIRFRYLPRDEHERVRRGLSEIPGRQYYDGRRPNSRMEEPHWVVPGDSISAIALVKYLDQAIRGKRVRRYLRKDTTNLSSESWKKLNPIILKDDGTYFEVEWDSDRPYDKPEKLDWKTDPEVADRLQFLILRAKTLYDMSTAHSSEWKTKDTYGNGDKPFPFQTAGVQYALHVTEESRLSDGRYGTGVMIADPMGLGKEQPLDAKILTPTGWTTMGEIKIGDEIIAADGKPCLVSGVFPQGEKDIYRITFSDGSSTECGKEHLWAVNSPSRNFNHLEPKVMSLAEIQEAGLMDKSGNRKWFIPMVEPVEFEEEYGLPLNPYLLGVILGDGGISQRTVMISSADQEIIESVRSSLPEGVWLDHSFNYDYRITSRRINNNPVMEALDELDLMGKKSSDKFIPVEYLFSSIETRIRLLQGLLDTDGHIRVDGNLEYTSSSRRLIEGIQFIIQSLGGVARIREKKTTHLMAYRISVQLPKGILPFSLSRKANAYRGRNKYPPTRAIESIEFVGRKQAQCIRVDTFDHLYVTDDCIVTHNTIEAIMTVCEAWEQEIEKGRKREDLRCLIICPASVKINWSREILKWQPKDANYTVQILRGRSPQRIIANFVICNPALLQKEFDQDRGVWIPAPLYTMVLAKKWFSVVADEAHQFKSWKAQRTQAAIELFSGRRWNPRNMAMENWRNPVPLRIMMSGSPVLNRPSEFVTQLESLGILDSFGGPDRFERAYETRDGHRLKELNTKLRERGYLRREKEDMVLTPFGTIIPLKNVNPIDFNPTFISRDQWEDVLEEKGYTYLPGVLGQMPPKLRTAIDFPLSNRKEYDHAEKNFIDWLKEHYSEYDDSDIRVARAMRTEALQRIIRLKWLAAKGKIDPAVKWIENFLDETQDDNEKLVVYVDHRDVFQMFRDKFLGSVGIIGGQTEEARQDAIDKFQTDPKIRVIVCMLGAGGVGLTLTAARHMLILELPWGPAILDQAEDRIYGRVNDLHGAAIYLGLAENTIDQNIASVIDSKREVVTAATQGAEAEQNAMIREIITQLTRQSRPTTVTDEDD
jgi:hypothetical protein